jgi:hypothetical protein
MMNLKSELELASLAIIDILGRAVTFPRVLKIISILAIERD